MCVCARASEPASKRERERERERERARGQTASDRPRQRERERESERERVQEREREREIEIETKRERERERERDREREREGASERALCMSTSWVFLWSRPFDTQISVHRSYISVGTCAAGSIGLEPPSSCAIVDSSGQASGSSSHQRSSLDRFDSGEAAVASKGSPQSRQ